MAIQVRNPGPEDAVRYGVHLAAGSVVTLPVTLEQSKIDAILAEFGQYEPEPCDLRPDPQEEDDPTAEPPSTGSRTFYRKKKATRKKG